MRIIRVSCAEGKGSAGAFENRALHFFPVRNRFRRSFQNSGRPAQESFMLILILFRRQDPLVKYRAIGFTGIFSAKSISMKRVRPYWQ